MNIKKADRLNDVTEYYFSRKLEEIRTLNAKGFDIINLGIGSPDMPPSDETIEAAIKSLTLKSSHGYTTSRGRLELREAIAQWFSKTYQVDLKAADEILPLQGSKEGILHISLAFLNPGDEALVPNPGYPTYAAATKLAGARVRPYDLTEENDWYPDLEKLKGEDLSKVKVMWINYPHMPTGKAASEKIFQELALFAEVKNILLCNDNPYSLTLNPYPLSILKEKKRFGHCLELNSLSKSFNMAGWRVGFLVGKKEFIDTVLQVKSNMDSGMFLPIQVGAEAALRNSTTWHQKRNEIYQSRREIVYQIFDQIKFQYDEDQVGLFVWGHAPIGVKNVEDFTNELLYKAHVFITPGFIFGSQGLRYARISLCASKERLEEALKRIVEAK